VTATIERGVEEQAPALAPASPRPRRRGTWLLALAFLAPAAVLLGALVVYPIVSTVLRSLYSASGERFVGLDNFAEVFERDRTQQALRNNLIWVLVAPAVATGLGLVLAVLAEQRRGHHPPTRALPRRVGVRSRRGARGGRGVRDDRRRVRTG
jgi:alpha-glucoside transport system permease protein